MITLTAPVVLNSKVGGSGTVAFDKLYLDDLRIKRKSGGPVVVGSAYLVSSANPKVQPLQGTIEINRLLNVFRFTPPSGSGFVEKPIDLDTQQKQDAADALIVIAPDAFEEALVTNGIVAGVFSSGVP